MSEDRRAQAKRELSSPADRAPVRERLAALREQELAELRRSLGMAPPMALAWRLLEIRRKGA